MGKIDQVANGESGSSARGKINEAMKTAVVDGVTITGDATVGNPLVGTGEANTNSNSGAGAGIAQAKAGVNLPLKSIVGGTNVNLNESADEIEIEAPDLVASSAVIADNTIVRGDGGAKNVQQSGVTISDLDEIKEFLSLKFQGVGQELTWNPDFKTVNIPTGLGPVLKVGQDLYFIIFNDTGGTIPKGTVVDPTGATLVGSEAIPTVTLGKADTFETSFGTLFVTDNEMLDQALGVGVLNGRVSGIDTSSFTPGDTLWLSAATAGLITNVRPEFPNYAISIGGVIKAAVSGEIGVNFTSKIEDTFNNFWNGTIRETFNFTVASDGATVTGSLEPDNGHPDLTMLFSGGFTTLDATPPVTIVLTPGTDTNPQSNFIYIPEATKVLTVATGGWPVAEHIKIAMVVLQSAAKVQTDDALSNQNWNDHIESTISFQGHLSHITERIRKELPRWDSGTAGSITINTGPTPDDVFVAVTGGNVYQLHKHAFPAMDMQTGDKMNVVNHSTTPFLDITNLNTQIVDALGVSLNNKSFSFVVWGAVNRTGETSHLMLNLPINSYSFASPQDAVDDALNFSVYDIPVQFQGVGFLIARFTLTFKNDEWVLFDTEDLRGFIPNVSAGGGVGGVGVTEWTGLTDTPSSYIGQAFKKPRVNAGETAIEFIVDTESIGIAASDETTDLTTGVAKATFRMPFAMTLTEVRANVNDAPTGSVLTVDINEGGASVLSTKITIDIGEKTSVTAAAPPVISDAALADDAEMTIDIDTIGSTNAGKGLKVWLIGTRL